MRAVLVNAPESLVEERRRAGIDKKDERWKGEWHFVNPPKRWHQRLSSDLFLVLAPLARRAGLDPYCDNTGIFSDPEQDWRVPDQAYARPEDAIEEGLSSAALVVEIVAQGDETYEKLAFYGARGVSEVLVVHEDRRFELHSLGADGRYAVDSTGPTSSSAVLPVTFSTVAGGPLRIDWADGSADV